MTNDDFMAEIEQNMSCILPDYDVENTKWIYNESASNA